MASKREIRQLILKWRGRLWLTQWLITPEVVEEIDPSDGTAFSTTAEIDASPTYRKAVVKVSKKSWREVTPQQRNRTICHEMLHVVTSPVSDFVKELLEELPPAKRAGFVKWWERVEEGTTEHLCNVILDSQGELR